MFDVDPERGRGRVGGVEVHDFAELERVVTDEDVVVGVLAVPAELPRTWRTGWSRPGVRIIFNYSEQLLQVPPEVTVHTSSPAVDLLYALYFYLA